MIKKRTLAVDAKGFIFVAAWKPLLGTTWFQWWSFVSVVIDEVEAQQEYDDFFWGGIYGTRG